MKMYLYLYHIIKAIVFRAVVLFPFEFIGFLNCSPVLKKKKNRVKRIAFQAYNPQVAQVYQSIIDELKKDHDIEIWFIVMFHPYHGFSGLKETRKFAHETLRINEKHILNIWEVYWHKFDCLICSDVYAKFPLMKTKKIIVPHGSGLLSRWVKKSLLRKTVADFDYYLLCGNLDLSQIKDNIDENTELIKTGFPFVDRLAGDNDSYGIVPELHNDLEKKIILYAPSWGHTYNYGDILSRNIKNVMDCLREKDVFVLLKLHAASFVEAQAKGICWKDKLEIYRNWDNVNISYDLDDIPYLKVADILISDISSRSFNFMITDKPVILYGVPQNFTRTTIEKMRLEKISEGAYSANTSRELSEALDRCLE